MPSIILMGILLLNVHASTVLSNGTFLLEGNWQIIQEPINPSDLVNRAYVDAAISTVPLTKPFNERNWFHYARIENATFSIKPDFYSVGWNSSTNGDFILPCSVLQNFTVMALVMGNVVDYFRSLNNSPCGMLQDGTKHLWSNNPEWGFVIPSFDPNHLGGSGGNWPRSAGYDSRDYLSFWGTKGTMAGGCCAYSSRVPNTVSSPGCNNGGYAAWCKSFDLWWR